LDKVELRGKIRGLREWQEGYEELEAIPCSFAIEFKDFSNDWGTWSVYTDSEEEKVCIICGFFLRGLTLPFSSSYSLFYTMQLVCKMIPFRYESDSLLYYIMSCCDTVYPDDVTLVDFIIEGLSWYIG